MANDKDIKELLRQIKNAKASGFDGCRTWSSDPKRECNVRIIFSLAKKLATRLQATERELVEARKEAEEFKDIEWDLRVYLAISHEDGKCCIYGDDGELQCNHLMRHGRCIDFAREPIADLLQVIRDTRMKEVSESQKAANQQELDR